MIPIPPTSSAIPPSAKVRMRNVVVAAWGLLYECGLVLDREVVGVRGWKLMLAAGQCADGVHGGNDLGFASDPHADALGVGSSEQYSRDEREWDEDAVVDVLAAGLPVTSLDSDHLELVAADSHDFAERVLSGEEPLPRDQS